MKLKLENLLSHINSDTFIELRYAKPNVEAKTVVTFVMNDVQNSGLALNKIFSQTLLDLPICDIASEDALIVTVKERDKKDLAKETAYFN